MLTPVYIPLNEEGLDELFIFKHKYEKSNDIKEHILYTDFIKKLKVGESAFNDSKTGEIVGFASVCIDESIYIIYTPVTDETLSNFKDEMDKVKFKPERLPKIDLYKVVDNPITGSFFVIDNEMHPI